MTGDFKFCPTCAHRLKPGAAAVEPAAGTRPRSMASMALVVGMAVFVGLIAGVGIWLFRDHPPAPSSPAAGGGGTILPPEALRAANVRTYLRHLPKGVGYRSAPTSEDPVPRPMQVEDMGVLLYEVPSAFYAEFVTDQRSRLADGEQNVPMLRRIWEPQTDHERQYAQRYLSFWVETYLQRKGIQPTATTPPPKPLLSFVPEADRQAAGASFVEFAELVPFPWPKKLGLLLLVPPSWAYENDFEELNWALPPGTAALPVTDVAWSDAVAFCEWLTARQGGDLVLRLPVDGEWRRAAHGNHPDWLYPWGSSPLTQACNSADLYAPGVEPILHPASQRYIDSDALGSHDGRTPDGLFGFAGNAGEWVLTQGDQPRRVGDALRVYYDAEEDRDKWYSWTFGGSFRKPVAECTVENQVAQLKYARRDEVGFRLVAVPRE